MLKQDMRFAPVESLNQPALARAITNRSPSAIICDRLSLWARANASAFARRSRSMLTGTILAPLPI
jgi:hypothetical protein